ncbi:MAG: dockerin type I domain-containing protein, partial [Verrucomicrobiota bacterium]|nr:dockerin type I domain-containing protein [Verrucomicrobiota bacterium]
LTVAIAALLSAISTEVAADQPTAAYSVIDLGPAGGDLTEGVGRGINDAGEVVGRFYKPDFSVLQAVYWPKSGTPVLLNGGGPDGSAYGINNSGQIAGQVFDDSTNMSHAGYWPSSSSGVIFLVPAVGVYPNANALAINASGQIAGNVFNADFSAGRVALWNNPSSSPVLLEGLPGLTNSGLGARHNLNDPGQVVGGIFNDGDTIDHAAFWPSSSSAAIDIGALGGDLTHGFAEALNNRGQIVGEAWSDGFAATRAAFWASGGSAAVELRALSAELSESNASGINERGQIVGSAFTADGSIEHALLWPDNTSAPIDLNDLIQPGSGWLLQDAVAINNSGMITGRGTIGGHTHSFILVPRPALYSVRDLGLVSADASESVARGINDLGQITGREFNADHSVQNALFWPAGGNALKLMGGAPGSAYAVNNNGQIVGSVGEAGPGPDHAVYWQNSTSAAATLAAPGEYPLYNGLHINANGQIVGNEFNDDGSAGYAVFWSNASSLPITLMNLPGSYTGTGLGARRCLNNAGQIVGVAYNNDVNIAHAVFWASSGSTPVDLGTLGGELTGSEADDINNSGQIAGYAFNDSFSNVKGVFWASSTSPGMALAPLSPEISNAQPSGINDAGQVVGEAFDPAFTIDRAVLWANSSSPATDLNSVIPPGLGLVLTRAIAINNPGAIVGDASVAGHTRGFLLQPLPPQLVQVASRKAHGSSGAFDIPMPLFGPTGVEDRVQVPLGSHKIVFTFTIPVTGGTATTSAGSVSSVQFSGNEMVVNLTNVTNAQVVTVTAKDVTGATGTLPFASANISFLAGDVNGDRSVNSADGTIARNGSGSIAGVTNFRADVNADGVINSADATIVRARSGDTLGAHPTQVKR